jgi:putative drug exporter of the RND superfamily
MTDEAPETSTTVKARRLSPRRLAAVAVGHPRRVLLVWGGIVLVGFVLISGLLGSALSSEAEVTSNPESRQAEDLIEERFPERDALDELVIVRSDDLSVTDPAFRERVASLADDLARSEGVEQVSSYLDGEGDLLISSDAHATILPVVLAGEEEDSIEAVIEVVQGADGEQGFAVDITGEFTVGLDFEKVSEDDLQQGELQFGLPAALIILLLVFGTLVGTLIPLTMALISIIVALALVAVIGQLFEVNLFVTNMLVAMGLALGIDYSLFIVSRLREERAKGLSHGDAILNVSSTATRAVVLSGTAFSLALLGMFLVPTTILRSLALGAIVVAIVSVGVALTFHPALLMALGDRIEKLRVPWLGKRVSESAGREGRYWGRAVRAVVRHPAISLVVSVAVLLLAAVPLLGLKLGASGPSSLPDDAAGKQGLIALERDFATGATEPVEIVVDSQDAPAPDDQLATLQSRLEGDADFAVESMLVEQGEDLTILSVALNAEGSSEEASAAIDRLRESYVPEAFGDAADQVLVGGLPAENRDFFALIGNWLPIVIAFVLALTLVLLTLAFRSIVIALTAIAVNLISVAAAYGLLVLVFQEGVGTDLLGFGQVDRIEAWVPVFLFSVLFGLSMDYQVFLLSRIRERYSATGDTTEAIVFGVGSTARLITGAALIIIVVFAGFASGELVSFQQMGFGVAIALLIDATIVRLVVIPAAMQLLGERNWYLPTWLEWLPHVEIEDPAATAGGPTPPANSDPATASRTSSGS